MTLQSYIHRSLRVVTTVGLLSLIWLVVLPWLGEQSVVREHIRMMEQGNIDPSAMYYTELTGLEEAEATFRELAEEYPELLWRRGGDENRAAGISGRPDESGREAH